MIIFLEIILQEQGGICLMPTISGRQKLVVVIRMGLTYVCQGTRASFSLEIVEMVYVIINQTHPLGAGFALI